MTWQDHQPDEEWVEDEQGDDDALLECPSCGEEVHEDTPQCPHCRQWITPIDRSDRGRRLLWVAVAILLVLVMSGVLML